MRKLVNPQRPEWEPLLQRPVIDTAALNDVITSVFSAVAVKGDKALLDFTQKFDQVSLKALQVTDKEIESAIEKTDNSLKEAIKLAKGNIEKFHAAQLAEPRMIETSPGVTCWQEQRAIEKVGLYIPGGSAPLFSTVLMLGIPAQLAGCEEIILCTPPDAQGNINPAILYSAALVGVTKIFKVGGSQAIAGLTYGTETIPQVYKIFGPGNQYVTAAKQKAQELGTAIDLPAGPSELMVVADETAIPAFVAADLLSQAEHGPDSQVICLVNSREQMDLIETELAKQLAVLPRKEIASRAIEQSSLILFDSPQNTVDFVNDYAPEHLILAVSASEFYLQGLKNAGSVFIGNYTPESAGDYASGTNHTLPTAGFARSYSGVNMDAFTKKITFQEITAGGLQNIGPAIEQMAEAEALQAHKNAVTLRLKTLNV
jgi:histidinol dehydrogenase